MTELFKAHSTETDWEWADKRRTIFKTPAAGAWAGVGTFVVGMGVRQLFSDPSWLFTSSVAGLVAVVVALAAPRIETFLIWLFRHKTRLEDLNEQRRLEQLDVTPPSPPSATAATPASGPRAEVSFECDQAGWARLRVTNAGSGADFTATIQLHGLAAGAVDGRQIYGKWELGDAAQQRLAAGETRTLRLASITQAAPGVRSWALHRSGGDDIRGVNVVEFMIVRLVAVPDLVQTCHLQVVLDAEGQSKMARVGVDPPLVHDVPPRVEDIRRLLSETVDYVRNMPMQGTRATVWVAVTVSDKVAALIGAAFGPKVRADYEAQFDAANTKNPDLKSFCETFLLRLVQQTKESDINPEFTLPTTWIEFYERQTGWEWPDSAVVETPATRLVLPEVIQKNLSDYPLAVELLVNGREVWVTIQSALYGCEDDMRDVRAEVTKHIVNGRLEVVVNNKVLGTDPCRGTPKELVVVYSIGDGPPIELRRKEHDTLRIP